MAADPADFALDHQQEGETFHASEKTGGGDGENGFGDDGLDHEPGDGLEFGGGDGRELLVAANEAFEAGFVEVVGPVGGVVGAAEDGETWGWRVEQRSMMRLLEAGGIIVDDGDDFVRLPWKRTLPGCQSQWTIWVGQTLRPVASTFSLAAVWASRRVAEGGAEFVRLRVVGIWRRSKVAGIWSMAVRMEGALW